MHVSIVSLCFPYRQNDGRLLESLTHLKANITLTTKRVHIMLSKWKSICTAEMYSIVDSNCCCAQLLNVLLLIQ